MVQRSLISICCACLAVSLPPILKADGPADIVDLQSLDEQFHDMATLLGRGFPESVRGAAASRLSRSNPGDPVFSDLLKDRNPSVRMAAVRAVGLNAFRAKKKLCPIEVIRALLDDNQEVRQTAANYTGVFERLPEEAFPVLVKALRHGDRDVRQSAAGDFHRLGKAAEQGVPELTKAMEDRDPFVRHNATVSLWHITRRAELVLRTNLQILCGGTTERKRDESMLLVATASFIRKMGVEATQDTASALIGLLRDSSPTVRAGAVRCLGALGQQDQKVRATLQELKAKEAVRALLDDQDDAVRREAKSALARLAK
ncbi:MAG: HEAT repeat domain-containing protein [Thermoguttaceae bacterium]